MGLDSSLIQVCCVFFSTRTKKERKRGNHFAYQIKKTKQKNKTQQKNTLGFWRNPKVSMENCLSIPQISHYPKYCILTHNTSLAFSQNAMLTMKVHMRTTQLLCASCLARRHQTGPRRVPSCSNGRT